MDKSRTSRGISSDKNYIQISARVSMSKEKYVKYRMLLMTKMVTQDKFFSDLIDQQINEMETQQNVSAKRKKSA